ncbi:MAG: hypothetical protein JO083_03495 [Candidatus Eremiobacteraeota bacterium]|nr:hypothetical protein [Candidatus Eremiobacteraeota bacterium]
MRILRDPEDPEEGWLAKFEYGGRSWCTQGAVVDEARYMAADLLTIAGVEEDALITFAYNDRESLKSLLAHPVTPSLLTEEEAEAELLEDDGDFDQEMLAALTS